MALDMGIGTSRRDVKDSDDDIESKQVDEDRRDLMKKVGAVSAAPIAASLAGCLGSSGEDTNSSSGDSSNKKTIRLLTAPSGFMALVMDHLYTDTDKIFQHFEEHNLNVEFDQSWEGAAIFTSGGADYETFGSLEAAQIATQRDIPVTINANLVPQFILIITNKGSEYDPAEAGSDQKAIDKLANDKALFGLAGWGGSTASAIVLAMQEGYGHTFVENPDESDFNITTAEWHAVPKLLERGDLKAGVNSPEHGMAAFVDENGEHPFAKIYQIGEVMEKAGFGVPQMNSWVCSQKITDEWPKASVALVQAYYEGLQWLFEDPMGRVEEDTSQHLKQLGVEEVYQAEWLANWGLELSLDNELPIMYEDIELTDNFIESDTKFLDTAQDEGYLGEKQWNELLSYRKVTQK